MVADIWMGCSLICVMVLLALGAQSASAQGGDGCIDHGVAADVSNSRGAAATVDGDGNRVVLVWLSDHRACMSVLVIDATTGETEQIEFERTMADSPFAVILSGRNRWYSQFGGRFHEFDAATRSFTFSGDCSSTCAMSMSEDPHGVIWAALYPGCHLVSFNPDTRELIDHPQLNEETWPQYPSYTAHDDAGWVYVGLGNTVGQVVGFHPPSGEIRKYIAREQRAHGCGRVFRGTDGKVYANGPGWSWHILDNGVATPLEAEEPPVRPAPMKAASWTVVFKGFPDGSSVQELNVPERYLKIQDADGTVRELAFHYESEGCHIQSVHLGPDGAIYGSTGHPLRVYRLDPATGQLTNNGLLRDNGHLNAMATQRGRIFGAMYGGGVLFDYDPARPWQDADPNAPNPRRLGMADPHINRPAVLLAHPDGRHLIMGGTPGYGYTGGGLYIYDLETGAEQLLTHEQMLENLSTSALVALPDGNLVGGTTTAAGTGGQPLAKEAELYLFDFTSRQVIWREVVLPGREWIFDLLTGPDGLVYGLASDSTFFVFDPAQRKLVHQEPLGETYGTRSSAQGPRVMTLGPDGNIYILFSRCVVRVEPGTFQHSKVAEMPVASYGGLALVGGRGYFASGSHVWSCPIAGLDAQ